MGFRTGSYATIWGVVESISDTKTKARISISRRNKMTGEYNTDFSGFVEFIGTSAANKALTLKERDRIKLGDIDVSNKYDKEKNITYVNYNVFSFDIQNVTSDNTESPVNTEDFQSLVGDGEFDDSGLPF